MSGKGLFDRLQEEIERTPDEGITFSDVLELPQELRTLFNQLARAGEATAEELAEVTGGDLDEVEHGLNELVERGFVVQEQMEQAVIYRPHFARRRSRKLPLGIWEALEELLEPSPDEEVAPPAESRD